MSRKAKDPTAVIPPGCEQPIRKTMRVDLLKMTRLLLDHLTPALCEAVFQQQRTIERTRKWTFYAVNLFWAAMLVRHPASLQQGLDETRKGRGRDKLWPRVMATPRAFFTKARGRGAPTSSRSPTRPSRATFSRRLGRPMPRGWGGCASGSPRSSSWMAPGWMRSATGSKLLRLERAQVLPGCLTVFYDLFRGITRHVLFFPNAAQAELPRAQAILKDLPQGTLLLGDRLDASVQYFHHLASLQLYGLFRRHGRRTLKRLKRFSSQQGHGSCLEDGLVEVGCGVGQPKVTLRLIRSRSRGRRLDVLTNVLDPRRLSPEEVLALYRLRWSVERLFLDLKETRDLHCLYAAASVHTAFRIAQAGIAKQVHVLPEQLSPAKLFPKLAQAANDHGVAQITVLKTRALNPGLAIRFPGWHVIPSSYTTLGASIVRHRKGPRRRRRFCASRKRWTSFMHVTGGPTLLQSVTDG